MCVCVHVYVCLRVGVTVSEHVCLSVCLSVQSTLLITTLGGASKGVLICEVSLYPKSHYMYYSGMGLCSGHGNSVVIRELSLYPQSLLAKLTVYAYGMTCATYFKGFITTFWS